MHDIYFYDFVDFILKKDGQAILKDRELLFKAYKIDQKQRVSKGHEMIDISDDDAKNMLAIYAQARLHKQWAKSDWVNVDNAFCYEKGYRTRMDVAILDKKAWENACDILNKDITSRMPLEKALENYGEIDAKNKKWLDIWNKIENYLSKNYPQLYDGLKLKRKVEKGMFAVEYASVYAQKSHRGCKAIIVEITPDLILGEYFGTGFMLWDRTIPTGEFKDFRWDSSDKEIFSFIDKCVDNLLDRIESDRENFYIVKD